MKRAKRNRSYWRSLYDNQKWNYFEMFRHLFCIYSVFKQELKLT